MNTLEKEKILKKLLYNIMKIVIINITSFFNIYIYYEFLFPQMLK